MMKAAHILPFIIKCTVCDALCRHVINTGLERKRIIKLICVSCEFSEEVVEALDKK